MSFWAKCTTKITDLTCFKESCRQNDVTYEDVSKSGMQRNGCTVQAVIRDNKGRSSAYLLRDQGAFRLMIDSDANYSSITKRLGKNGGRLTRDYAVGAITKNVRQSNAMINSISEQPDGSMVIRISAVG